MSLTGGRFVPGRRDPVRRPYRPLRPGARWIVLVALATLLGGELAWVVARLGGIGLPRGLPEGVILAAALAQRLTAAVHGPPAPLPGSPAAPTTEAADRPFAGPRRWEDRLTWTRDDPVAFERTVRPQLVAAVDERLRHLYGIGLAGDGRGGSDRVRALLGERLWHLVTEPTRRVPRPAELSGLVDDMERLFAEQGGTR